MANAISFSPAAATLALRTGDMYIGTGDVGKGPTSGTTYYHGITPPVAGFTTYRKAGSSFDIRLANTNNELIRITNQIRTSGGPDFTTEKECFVYYRDAIVQKCLNIDYELVSTEGLICNVDFGFLPCWPMTQPAQPSGDYVSDVSLIGNDGDIVIPVAPAGNVFNNSGQNYQRSFLSINDGSYINFGLGVGSPANLFSFGTGDFTLEVVFRPMSPPSGYSAVMCKGSEGYLGYGIFLYQDPMLADPEIFATLQSSGNSAAQYSFGAISNGSIYHVIITFDRSGDVKAYINGSQSSPYSITNQNTTLDDNDFFFSIGAQYDNNLAVTNFETEMDFFLGRVYNRVLTDDEISNNYTSVSNRIPL